MKRLSILVFTLFIALNITSQTLNLDETLPIDQTIKKGVLPNGMTYYIKSTDVVKDAASYYIIQNVGSILENEDQRGLAHFLEHMAFNGTQNFPGKGVLNTLQKHGAVFGKDINAYTSFDETVYNMNNIPTKDGLVDTCLTILHDWSNYLLLTDKEIDAERGVIKEEWRARQSGQMRLFNKSLPTTYNNSKYASRLPIGLMSVVENFDYKALRDFYHDWYRTDLQAIAVIGDFDVDEIENKIIEKFSSIPAIENPRERFIVNIPENTEMLYNLGIDPEVTSSNITFGMRHYKSLDTETVKDLKRTLQESMVTSMINARISEQTQKPDAPFLAAFLNYGSMSITSNALTLQVYPKPGMQQEGFKAALTEIIRALKFGFTETEIERSISEIKSSYENQIAKKEDLSHARIVRVIQQNYLENKTISDIEKEYELTKKILSNVTPKTLHDNLKRMYIENNRYLNVTGIEGKDNLTQDAAKQIINTVENSTIITPYTESLEGKSLISGVTINSGKITETKVNSDIGATTYMLSNGINVHYKFVDKEKDKVALRGVSYGGTSLLKDEELPSASLVPAIIQFSGLGEFNATDLKKILAGNTANIRISIDDINENITGNSNKKDVETMMQMLHLHFVKPRFDEQAYQVLSNNIDNYLIRRSKDVNEQISDSLTVSIYGKNNPKKSIFNQEYADLINFDTMKSIYEDRFADASDFEFFIVGDVNSDQLEPLLEKYLASIPTNNTSEKFVDNSAQWLSSKIDKDVYLKMEDPKARVNIAYKKEMPYSLKNAIYTDALGDILQLRILETIRESEGGAYSPNAYARFFREPKSQAFAAFSFDCNPDLVENLVDIVHNEFKKIANGDILEDDLNKTRTNFLKEREQSKDKNAYDMQLLNNFFRYNYNMNDSKNFDDIVENMTKSDVQNIAKQLLDNGKSYEIIFKPKQ